MRKPLYAFFHVLYGERVFALILAVTLLALLGGLGFALLEEGNAPWSHRVGEGLWWALVTLTTVGYGDVVPHTIGGRLMGIGLMLSGVVMLSLLTATVASVFIEKKFRRERGLEPIKSGQHILILGWHEDTEILVDKLVRYLPAGTGVVLVNRQEPELLEALKDKYHEHRLQYYRGDFSREETLEKANVRQARKAIILAERSPEDTAAGVDQRTLLTALTLKDMHPQIRILAELLRPENRSHLERAGVDEVLIRGQYDGALLAGATASPGLFRVFTHLLTGEGQNLWEVEVPARYQGRPLGDFARHLKEYHQALVIALFSENLAVHLEELLSKDPSAVDEFIRRKFTEAGMTHLFGRSKIEYLVNPPDSYILETGQHAVVIATHRPSL